MLWLIEKFVEKIGIFPFYYNNFVDKTYISYIWFISLFTEYKIEKLQRTGWSNI